MSDYFGRNLEPSTIAYLESQVATGHWRIEEIPPEVTGLSRPVPVIRGRRSQKTMLTFDWHGDKTTFCPPTWWDLGIGSGACGLGCRACFLMLTFRTMNDPLCHRLYDNVEDYPAIVETWLKAKTWMHPKLKGKTIKLDGRTSMGLGIDRSDSLLYEGVTGHARRLIPLFVNPETNPDGRRLILLTKSDNARYLDWRQPGDGFEAFRTVCGAIYRKGQPVPNVSVTFSLSPDPIADLWEGKWPDTLERITPHIDRRLSAAGYAAELGFDVRWRLDPILPVDGWQDIYRDWFREAVKTFNARPSRITLGTYREKNAQLDTWREKWGLPPMEWQPADLVSDGTHWHLAAEERAEIYGFIARTIREVWSEAGRDVPAVSLCKENNGLRKQLGLCNAQCNCL